MFGIKTAECPPPQSYEFWRALKRHSVPMQLVVHAGKGHRIRQPDNRRDILRRSAQWLESALQSAKPKQEK